MVLKINDIIEYKLSKSKTILIIVKTLNLETNTGTGNKLLTHDEVFNGNINIKTRQDKKQKLHPIELFEVEQQTYIFNFNEVKELKEDIYYCVSFYDKLTGGILMKHNQTSLNSFPVSVKHREKQFRTIFELIQLNDLIGSNRNIIYLCGPSGSGKSLTIHNVLKSKEIQNLCSLSINLDKFKNIKDIYIELYNKFVFHYNNYLVILDHIEAKNELKKFNPKGIVVFDNIINIKEFNNVVFELLDTNLIFFGISTITILGGILFPPYSVNQIKDIIKEKFKNNSFEDEAFQYVAEKTFNFFNGDIRQSFNICNDAISLCEIWCTGTVTYDDVIKVINKFIENPIIRILKCLTPLEKLIIYYIKKFQFTLNEQLIDDTLFYKVIHIASFVKRILPEDIGQRNTCILNAIDTLLLRDIIFRNNSDVLELKISESDINSAFENDNDYLTFILRNS